MSANGQRPPGATLTQGEAEAIAAEAYTFLRVFLPAVPEKIVSQIATGVIGDVVSLQKLLVDVANGDVRAWGIELTKQNLVQLAGLGGRATETPVGFKIPADPRAIKTPEDMLRYVGVLGLVTSTPARALIAAMGFKLKFVVERNQSSPQPNSPQG